MTAAPKGMTLIEIMVVIAIIGIVGTVVAVGVVGYFRDAKIESCKTQLHKIAQAVGSRATTPKGMPESLSQLVEEKYISKKDLTDPWGGDIQFDVGSSGDIDDFELRSAGPDGSPGNDDDVTTGQDDE